MLESLLRMGMGGPMEGRMKKTILDGSYRACSGLVKCLGSVLVDSRTCYYSFQGD